MTGRDRETDGGTEGRGSWAAQVRDEAAVSGVASWGAREAFFWVEDSGVPSGCEFCLELVGRVCFLAVTFIYWAGKEVGNVELGFGDCVCWKRSLCKAEALSRTCTSEAEAVWVHSGAPFLPYRPLPPSSLPPLALSRVLFGRKAV